MVAKKESRRPVTRQNPSTSSEHPPSNIYKPSDIVNPHPEGRNRQISPKQYDYAHPHHNDITAPPGFSSNARSKRSSTSSTSSTTSTLVPVHTSNHQSPVKRTNYSNPAVFKEIRDEFASKVGPHQSQNGAVMQAWRSNPSSRNPSRNPSRQGSRQPSSRMRRANSNLTIPNRSSLHEDDLDETDPEEIVFYPVVGYSHTLPKPSKKLFSVGSSESFTDPPHLPSITERDSFSKPVHRRWHSESLERRNGYTTGTTVLEARTEMGVEEVMGELARVANSLKIREMEQTSGSSVVCLWDGIKIQVSVNKTDYVTCKLNFQWLAGGDLNQFREKRDKLFKRLKL